MDQQRIKFKRNESGNIILFDQKGEEVLFHFPIDATEALGSLDESKRPRYFVSNPLKQKAEPKEDNEIVKQDEDREARRAAREKLKEEKKKSKKEESEEEQE
jgi:uncharacterized protein YrzB (UPF0473 family)